MTEPQIVYNVCDLCKDGRPKCTQCAFEEVKTDAIITALKNLRNKRKIRIGGQAFSLNGDITTEFVEPPRKKTKVEQIGDVCEAMESFSTLCKNLNDPDSVKAFGFNFRVSLTFPVEKDEDSIDKSIDLQLSVNKLGICCSQEI